MATQMQLARKGIITEAMKQVAAYEGVTEEFIRKGVAEGTIAIPLNINHKNVTPRGVGQGLSVKVNANIGTSSSYPDPEPELEKLAAQIEKQMRKAAADLNFEAAAELRDKLIEIRKKL